MGGEPDAKKLARPVRREAFRGQSWRDPEALGVHPTVISFIESWCARTAQNQKPGEHAWSRTTNDKYCRAQRGRNESKKQIHGGSTGWKEG